MSDFYRTQTGRQFYEYDVPQIIEGLNRIYKELSRANDLKERELKLKEFELRKGKGEVINA